MAQEMESKEACLRQVVDAVNEAIEALESVVKSEVPEGKCSWCLFKMGGYMTRFRRLANDLREQNEELIASIYLDEDFHFPYGTATDTLREILVLCFGFTILRLKSILSPEHLENIDEKVSACYDAIDKAIKTIEGEEIYLKASKEAMKKSRIDILKDAMGVRFANRRHRKCKCQETNLKKWAIARRTQVSGES